MLIALLNLRIKQLLKDIEPKEVSTAERCGKIRCNLLNCMDPFGNRRSKTFLDRIIVF